MTVPRCFCLIGSNFVPFSYTINGIVYRGFIDFLRDGAVIFQKYGDLKAQCGLFDLDFYLNVCPVLALILTRKRVSEARERLI